MPNFSQQSSDITTLHILNQDTRHLSSHLRKTAATQKAAAVIPCLATEFITPENQPIFRNILFNLSKVEYLRHIIFGVDNATEEDVGLLKSLLDEYGLNNAIVQWNNGPILAGIFRKLTDAGFEVSSPGKGRNLFMSSGICLALEADAAALMDADIISFSRDQVDRLFYPVMALEYDFVKGYYSRIHNNHFYGRVKRLLIDPLLLALQRQEACLHNERAACIISFLLNFRYQLSGEVALKTNLLRAMSFSMDWGVELYSLIEASRKASSICQVQFSLCPFDHKHQSCIPGNAEQGGLQQMAQDIISTLFHFLIREQNMMVGEHFFSELLESYLTVAHTMITKYEHDSIFNNLSYDRGIEEELACSVFAGVLRSAGETFARGQFDLSAIPHTPSWEQVCHIFPDIFEELKAAINI